MKIESRIGFPFQYTPHSPRAGFASEAIRDGYDVVQVKEAGRWAVDSSLRTYIDLVAVSQIEIDVLSRGLLSLVEYAEHNLIAFFP